MKKTAFAVVLLSLFALPVLAGNGRLESRMRRTGAKVEVKRLDRSQAWVKRLLGQALEAKNGVGASAIIVNRSARQLVVPSAGSVRGANGTFYRSDITFVNYNEADQDVAVFWFPNGANPDAIEVAGMTIPGLAPPFTVEDFVGAGLGFTGLGSLVFLPVTEEDFDPNAAIDIFSVIWSPQPNASGIVSFPFPAVDFGHLQGEFEAIILGLRQDGAHRTNYGLVNLSNLDELTFNVAVFTEDGFVTEEQISIPAGSMLQKPAPAGSHGNFSLLISVEDPDDELGNDFAWTAYASSNNNISNDGWVSIAASMYDDDDLDTAGVRSPRNR